MSPALKHSSEIVTGISVAISGLKNQSGWDKEALDLECLLNRIMRKSDEEDKNQ